MTLTPKHTGVVQNGKVHFDNRSLFDWDVSNFEGKDVQIIVKGIRNTRSNRMNRYYWGVIVNSLTSFFNAEHTFGRVVDPDEVHQILKSKFLGFERIYTPGDGKQLDVLRSTSTLNNREFIEYFEQVIAWSSEFLTLEIPLPNEYGIKKY